MRLWGVFDRGPDGVLGELVVVSFVLAVPLLAVLALESPEGLLLGLAAGVSLAWFGCGSACCCNISSSTGTLAWLGSCSMGGAASFTGSDSNVSIGSSAAVATPSGFISPEWSCSVSAGQG